MQRVNVFKDDEIEGRILDGHFDLDKATAFEDAMEWDGNNNRGRNSGDPHRAQELLRTAGGRWALRRSSAWQSEQTTYEFLDDAAAKQWLEIAEQYDAVERYFGEIEDERGPGRPSIDGEPISFKPGAALLARIDEYAKDHYMTRADAMRSLLADGLTASAALAAR
jgi:hypothetical protein